MYSSTQYYLNIVINTTNMIAALGAAVSDSQLSLSALLLRLADADQSEKIKSDWSRLSVSEIGNHQDKLTTCQLPTPLFTVWLKVAMG